MLVTYTHVIVHILIDPAKSFIDVSKETQTARAETNLDLNLVHLWVEFFCRWHKAISENTLLHVPVLCSRRDLSVLLPVSCLS